MRHRIIFATANEGKMREVRLILADLGMEVISMKEAGASCDIEENGSTFAENAVEIKRMSMLNVKDKADQWSQYGGNLGSKLDNMSFHLEDIAGSFSGFNMNDLSLGEQADIEKVGSVGNVKNVEGDVRLADEDLKLYRDLAERRYMNQIELKTLAPNINVTLPAGAAGNLNASDVADHIKRILIEQMNSHTDMSH